MNARAIAHYSVRFQNRLIGDQTYMNLEQKMIICIIDSYLDLLVLDLKMKILSFGWEQLLFLHLENFTEKDCGSTLLVVAIVNSLTSHTKVQPSDGTFVTRGNKTLLIYYNYPVKSFDGKKYFVIATTSWIGGKNLFLGKFPPEPLMVP